MYTLTNPVQTDSHRNPEDYSVIDQRSACAPDMLNVSLCTNELLYKVKVIRDPFG